MRRFLDISFNKISALSAELSNLDGLSTLNLSFNALGVFPDVLSCMTCLRELNLDSTGVWGCCMYVPGTAL
jgi:Leucine-rich repeat (LRR) protein